MSREEHDPTLREPCGPAPENGWVFAYPDVGYQTWRSRHRTLSEHSGPKALRTLSRAPTSLTDQPVFQSAREPEIRRRLLKLCRTSAVPKAGCSRIPPEQLPEGFRSVSAARCETSQHLDPFCFSREKPSPPGRPLRRRATTWTRPEERGASLSYLRHRKDRPGGHLSDRRTNNPRRSSCP